MRPTRSLLINRDYARATDRSIDRDQWDARRDWQITRAETPAAHPRFYRIFSKNRDQLDTCLILSDQSSIDWHWPIITRALIVWRREKRSGTDDKFLSSLLGNGELCFEIKIPACLSVSFHDYRCCVKVRRREPRVMTTRDFDARIRGRAHCTRIMIPNAQWQDALYFLIRAC